MIKRHIRKRRVHRSIAEELGAVLATLEIITERANRQGLRVSPDVWGPVINVLLDQATQKVGEAQTAARRLDQLDTKAVTRVAALRSA